MRRLLWCTQPAQGNISHGPLQHIGVSTTTVIKETRVIEEHSANSIDTDAVGSGTLRRRTNKHYGSGPGRGVGISSAVGFYCGSAAAYQDLSAFSLIYQRRH